MSNQDTTDRKFQKELNSGTAALVLLSILSRAVQPMYGYQIAKLTETGPQDVPIMKQGTLYPVLRSLESQGLLASEVEPSVAGPPRRYYRITESGCQTLERWQDIWSQTKVTVDAILEGREND